MKKILTALMLLALFVSCSSDDDNTDPNNENLSETVGIYKGRAIKSYLIFLSNNKGVYVNPNGDLSRFTWKNKDINTIETVSSNGEVHFARKSNNPKNKFNFNYRESNFTLVVTQKCMNLDEQIVGRWKVKYSNTIRPVFYFKSEEELDEIKKNTEIFNPDVKEWHWYRKDDMGWDQRSVVKEYHGGINEVVNSSLFDQSEMAIEISEDFIIRTYRIDYSNMKYIPLSTSIYYVEDGKIIKGGYLDQGDGGGFVPLIKYRYDKQSDNLSIQLPREYQMVDLTHATNMYITSKYSRIE